MLTGKRIKAGDVLIGLPSTGLHTNGYSLARKLLFEVAGYGPDTYLDELHATVADELLRVHRSYLRPIVKLRKPGLLKGAAHVTGGGLSDNVPRMLQAGLAAEIEIGSWPELPIFGLLRAIGNIPEHDYRRTFNLGIGMVLAVGRKKAEEAVRVLRKAGETPFQIGRIIPHAAGGPRVVYR
jgi:phosphoribosylformylglycinamidine cyclo-ligase